MVPASFSQSNDVLDKPPAMTYEECEALSVWRGVHNGFPLVVSCWKPTAAELEEIARTGRVWLLVYGPTMLPSVLSGHNPFAGEG